MGSVTWNGRSRYSLRRPRFDYTRSAAYFVTMCIRHRLPLLGRLKLGRLELSDVGHMVWDEWLHLPVRFPDIALDSFVAMPDHVHGIVHLIEALPLPDRKRTLGKVVGEFKSRTTSRYFAGVRDGTWMPVDGRLWLRSYWDVVIRDKRHLDAARLYIARNPFALRRQPGIG